MLKGIGESEGAIGIAIFVGGLLVAFAIIYGNFIYTSATVINNNEQLGLLNAVHIAKVCFSNDNGILDPGKINYDAKKSCGIDAKVCVRDMVSKMEWLDCSQIVNSRANIYAPLISDSDVSIGEIQVQE